MFRDLFPTVEEQKHYPRIALLTVWLGTNDSTFPGSSQHVPLDRFAASMKDIFSVVRERSPQTKIILITPPPIYTPDVQTQLYDKNDPPTQMNRSVEVQGTYVQAVKDLGREEKIPVVDAWEPIWEAAGSKQPEAVQPFLSDVGGSTLR
jgi:lysophospholipase L1-like esterase